MFYTGMTQTRNIPMINASEGKYTGMEMRKINKTSDFSQGKQGKKHGQQKEEERENDEYVQAENLDKTNSGVFRLKQKEEGVAENDLKPEHNKISLEQIYQMQGEYNFNREKINKENKLREDILKAEEKGDYQLMLELKKEYQREKSVRRSQEYTVLQRAVIKEEKIKGQGHVMAYKENAREFSKYVGKDNGNHINITSG